MASEKILLQKQKAVEALAEKLKGSVAGVLADYKGINVENDTKLRRELREAGVEYTVIKNSILRRACEDAGLEELKAYLTGTTALALSGTDAVAPAKVLEKYASASRGAYTIKAGFVEGGVLDAPGVEALAKLPGREELVAQTLRGFNAPISGFVNVLSGNIRGLVIALGKIAEKSA
ncbi:MAG: 50S ribosomal protein L10 [Oscillospiraceae bacterium]|nr:50S ribosomal protein L10 [Oscillospiraceae bacterium]